MTPRPGRPALPAVRPRLVATDLDGTLLAPDETVTPRTRRALDRARRSGLPVLLVTGRPPRWMAEPVAETGVPGPVICANGAIVYDPAAGAILQHATLASAVAARLVVGLRAAAPGTTFACEMGLAYGREPGYAPLRLPLPDRVRVGDALDLVAGPVTKLLVRHPGHAVEALATAAEALAGADAEVTWSTPHLVEIHGAGVTKASTLARWCAAAGIHRSEVVAFGDMPNDLAMLRWAGTGVAVANAHPDVLAAADAVTASNADDGVAAYLEALLSG